MSRSGLRRHEQLLLKRYIFRLTSVGSRSLRRTLRDEDKIEADEAPLLQALTSF
jgi:hypothetical protein